MITLYRLIYIHYFQEWSIFPALTLMPVAENCNDKSGSFLCKYPLFSFTQETNVPVLMGMNSGEGGIFAARELMCTYIVFKYLPS